MVDYLKLLAYGLIALCAAIAANYALDVAYMVHAIIVMLVSGGLFLYTLRTVGDVKAPIDTSVYMDDVVRYGVIATAFWGVVAGAIALFVQQYGLKKPTP